MLVSFDLFHSPLCSVFFFFLFPFYFLRKEERRKIFLFQFFLHFITTTFFFFFFFSASWYRESKERHSRSSGFDGLLVSWLVGAMGQDENKGADETEQQPAGTKTPTSAEEEEGHPAEMIHRSASESSIYATEDEDDDEGGVKKINLGPQCTLKEHIEKDKVSPLTHSTSGLSLLSFFLFSFSILSANS